MAVPYTGRQYDEQQKSQDVLFHHLLFTSFQQLLALQQSVDTLLALRQKITEKTAGRLKAIGIVIPDAQG